MAVVNFTLPKTLERRIGETLKEKGFASKAEFFRFAAVHFLDVINRPIVSEQERFEYLTDALREEVLLRYREKKLPLLEEQLGQL